MLKESFYTAVELLFLVFVGGICVFLIESLFHSILNYTEEDTLVVGVISTFLLLLIATVFYKHK